MIADVNPGRFGRCGVLAALLAIGAGFSTAAEHVAPANGDWSFQVLLDGKPIGQHRFSLEADGNEARLTSEARFDVRVLGFSVYRYRHSALERWRGACLVTLSATTDDDGKRSTVRATTQADRLVVDAVDGTPSIEGCVMSFAYWNPAMLAQTRLLNAQTGRLEVVEVRRIAGAPIDVRGAKVMASGFRIAGIAQPIEVWYSSAGEWIGLDSIVGGHHRLSYRLP